MNKLSLQFSLNWTCFGGKFFSPDYEKRARRVAFRGACARARMMDVARGGGGGGAPGWPAAHGEPAGWERRSRDGSAHSEPASGTGRGPPPPRSESRGGFRRVPVVTLAANNAAQQRAAACQQGAQCGASRFADNSRQLARVRALCTQGGAR